MRQSNLKNYNHYDDIIFYLRILLPDGPHVTNFTYNFQKATKPHVLLFVLDNNYNLPKQLKYKNKISAKRDIKRRLSEIDVDKYRFNRLLPFSRNHRFQYYLIVLLFHQQHQNRHYQYPYLNSSYYKCGIQNQLVDLT